MLILLTIVLFFPPNLGEEWNEVVGRESIKDFQMIGYVVKTCENLGVKWNIKKLQPKLHEGTPNFWVAGDSIKI